MSVDVRDRDELEAWLEKQPREVVVSIAVRSALRILPLLTREKFSKKTVKKLILPVFRASMLAWEVGQYPDKSDDLRPAVRAAAVSASAGLGFDVNVRKLDKLFNASFLWETADATEVPHEIERHWQELKENLLGLDKNWQVWTDWYEARLYPDKFPAPNKKLELARAMIPNEIWDQGWEVVNPYIEKLVAEHTPESSQRHVFISYNSTNLTKAKWIGDFVEKAGYRVFAQYKDMPPGSNFVHEMQNGLRKMGKMIAIQSPEYENSKQCQAEWSAAYNEDPNGEKRLIVPVMVEETTVSPLANQVVQIRAYKQSEKQTFEAVLARLSDEVKVAGNLRQAISDVASPSPSITSDGKLDVGSNNIFDKPVVEDSLFDLADTQLTLKSVLEAILPDNVPDAVVVGLQKYGNELRAKGVQPSTGTLEAMQAIVKASMAAPAGSNMWIDEGVQEAFRQFSKKHAEIMKHYPLKSVRNEVYEQAEVDESAATGEALSQPLDDLLGVVKQAHEAGLTTNGFLQVVEDREQIMRLVASAPVEAHATSKISAKKRGILQDSGFVDKAIERAQKVAKIADTGSGKAMISGLKKVAASLWKFID